MGWTTQVPALQRDYARDLADWLDGAIEDNPCSLAHAYDGFEIIMGACLSALDHTRVDLPLSEPETIDALARMRQELPETPSPGS